MSEWSPRITRLVAVLAASTLGVGLLTGTAAAAPESLVGVTTGVPSTLAATASSPEVMPAVTLGPSSVDRISRMSGFNARGWTVTQPDANGVRYVGGDFTSFQAWDTGRAARVALSDGAVDATFPKVNGDVDAVEFDGNGGYVIGGMFGSVDGQTRTRLAHIRADGSLNPDFAPVVNNRVQSISVSGSVVVIGGLFTDVNGSTRDRLAALSLDDGSLLDWNPAANNWLMKVLVVGDDVFVGGRFTSIGGLGRTLLAQVRMGARTAPATGTCLDNWDAADCVTDFAPTMTGYAVFDVAVSGSTVYATGNFSITPSGGSALANLAAMDDATVADNVGVSAWNGRLIGQGEALTIHNDVLYVGGGISGAGGQGRGMGAAFDIGSDPRNPTLTDWNPRATQGGNYNDAKRITDIEIAGDTAYLAGSFWALGTATGSIARNRIGAVDLVDGDATSWDPHICDWTNGVARTSYDIAVSGSTAVFGGNFDCVGGLQRRHAAAIGADGILTSWAPAVDGSVYAFASNGQTIYMSGQFSRVIGEDGSGGSRSSTAAVDTSGSVTNWAPAPNGRPVDLLVTGSSVYMAGFFSTVGGVARRGVAKVDAATGSLDTAFDAQLNAEAEHLAIDNGRLYMAGRFSAAAGQARPNYVAVDATTGALDSWNVGTPNAFNNEDESHGRGLYGTAIAVMGNRVFLGGSFLSITPASSATPVTQRYTAAVDAVTGELDLDWRPATVRGNNGNGDVYEIATTSSAIYLGGQNAFSIVDNGETRERLAAVDPQTGALLSWDPQAGTGEIRGLSTSAASVFIAGSFNSMGGATRQNTAAMGRNGVVGDPWPMNPATSQSVVVTTVGQQNDLGSLVSSPPGLSCEIDSDACNYGFATGQTVTLTAVPASGANFDGWSGACAGSNATCIMTIGPSTLFGASFSSAPSVTTVFSAEVLPAATPPPSPPNTVPSQPGTNQPAPAIPAAAPIDVAVVAGDDSALVSWSPPQSTGSFPITHYEVSTQPPAASCVVPVEVMECELSGVRNGTEYEVRVRALTGAGWGSWSEPMSVTPQPAQDAASIVITGSRDGAMVQVSGQVTGMSPGEVTVMVRWPGQRAYSPARTLRVDRSEGSLLWQRRTKKKVYVYFQATDLAGERVRSRRIIIPRMGR